MKLSSVYLFAIALVCCLEQNESNNTKTIKADEFRYTYIYGEQWVLELKHDDIRRRKWTVQMSNPPVSAREAIAKADKVSKIIIKNLKKDNNDSDWAIESVALMPLDRKNPDIKENKDCWFWLVRYEDFSLMSGQPSQFEVAVLMDGSVISPKREEENEKKAPHNQ
jgi:hypothetical protein